MLCQTYLLKCGNPLGCVHNIGSEDHVSKRVWHFSDSSALRLISRSLYLGTVQILRIMLKMLRYKVMFNRFALNESIITIFYLQFSTCILAYRIWDSVMNLSALQTLFLHHIGKTLKTRRQTKSQKKYTWFKNLTKCRSKHN